MRLEASPGSAGTKAFWFSGIITGFVTRPPASRVAPGASCHGIGARSFSVDTGPTTSSVPVAEDFTHVPEISGSCITSFGAPPLNGARATRVLTEGVVSINRVCNS